MAHSQNISLDEARAIMRAQLVALTETESVLLGAALGRVNASDVSSPIAIPAYTNAAMDGYAFAASELDESGAARLEIIGSALAGRPFDQPVPRGSCVAIMTGAMLPAGCDTVVAIEKTHVEGTSMIARPGQRAHQHRRLAGEDLARGALALARGRRITPADLGLIASLGIERLTVQRRARIAYFSTGDELRSPGQAPGAATIYDSNSYTVRAMLAAQGVEMIDLGIAGDSPAAVGSALDEARDRADMILISGGVSVGAADYTRQILAERGSLSFQGVAMKPGKPIGFGRIDASGKSLPFFGLPGNPAAVMACYYALVREAVSLLCGDLAGELPKLRLISDAAIGKSSGRTEFLRGLAYRDGMQWRVRLTDAQGSANLVSMSQANCLIELPHENTGVAAGDTVSALPFHGLI